MNRYRPTVTARVRRGCVALVTAVTVASMGFTATAAASPNPIGMHSMLQLNDPPALMQAMFAEASGAGASAIRLDVAPALIDTSPTQPPDFTGLNEVMALSRQYNLPVVGDLFTIPYWIADCATPTGLAASSRCPTADLADYGAEISQIVGHANPVIQDWEIWNEPDSQQFFTGTPQQYAMMLRTAHDAIKAINPADDVLLGGVSGTSARSWLAQVFATPGADAAQAFDIANVHERAALDSLAPDIEGWKSFFASAGFTGPLWITEHGYPSDPAYQYDPSYKGGPASQAAYLTASIPTLIDAGASEVFVTERDNLSGQFASEGLLSGDFSAAATGDPGIVEKPAYTAVRSLGGCYTLFGRDCAGPTPVATPSALSIPATRLGTQTASAVTISNSGAGPDVLGSAVLQGQTPDPITISADHCSGQILEPNQTCQIWLHFAPQSAGPAAASLQLPSDDGNLDIAVSAVAPSVSSLTSLADPTFTPVRRADGVGYPQQVTLRLSDPLDTTVGLDRASIWGPDGHRFRIRSDHCVHITLGPGGSCELTVRFSSARPGPQTATLSLRGVGDPLRISLRATAFALPAITAVRALTRLTCTTATSTVRTVVRVTTSQPAQISWQLRREARRAIRPCGKARAALPRATRWSARGRTPATGRVAVSRGRHDTGGATRFSLPGRILDRLRPGTYLLTIDAQDTHGTGPTRSQRITIGR